MRPNPNVKNPCPSCQGWAFFMVSRDPDRDADCTVCDNGERRKEGANMSDCGWCGAPNTHYMTHICTGCECWHREARIPAEPHIQSYIESEWNPDCPVHAGKEQS